VVPVGLHYDDAFNGLDAYKLLSTPFSEWPLFFTGNFGREPLLIYLLAIAQAVSGPSAATLRSVTGIIAIVLVPAVSWLGWELASSLDVRNRRLFALWSGAVTLTLLWMWIFGRTVIRIDIFILLTTLWGASFWRAWRTGGMRWWVITGIFAGLSFYTYIPARALPLLMVVFVVLGLLIKRDQRRTQWVGPFLSVLMVGIMILPLGIYFVNNPLSFLTRSEQVNILTRDQALELLLANIKSTLGMFMFSGDMNPRYNIPGRPVLDPIMSIFFVIGLVVLLRKATRTIGIFLLLWGVAMILPTILTEYAPSYHRAAGITPVLVIVVSLGLYKTHEYVSRLSNKLDFRKTGIVLSVIVGMSLVLTGRSFLHWNAMPQLFYARDVGFWELANASLPSLPQDSLVYISPRGVDHPTVQYGLLSTQTQTNLVGFDGRFCVRVSPNRESYYVFLGQEDQRGPGLVNSYLPDLESYSTIRASDGSVWADIFYNPGGGVAVFPEMRSFPVTLLGGIDLNGYWLSSSKLVPGDRLYVRLFWGVDSQPGENYTTFVQLLQKSGDGGWKWFAGADAQPGRGSCVTQTWMPGEIVVDEYEFVVPAELDSEQTYYIAVGFYTPEDGSRLLIPDNPENQILLGPLPVR
jgi:hypothetical protein